MSDAEKENSTQAHGFSLFAHTSEITETVAQQRTTAVMSEAEPPPEETLTKAEEIPSKEQKQTIARDLEAMIEHGWKVKVVGKVVDSARDKTFIVAGTTQKQATGEIVPVALIIDAQTAGHSEPWQNSRGTIHRPEAIHSLVSCREIRLLLYNIQGKIKPGMFFKMFILPGKDG